MSLIRDITKVSVANIISLAAVIITGFIVPGFLSIEQYAYLKTFTLVLSFVGILHLGYTDGIYIKYGGKYLKDLDLSMFKTEKTFFVLFQLCVAILILVVGIVLKEPIIIAVSAAVLPYNIISYYQFFYQAVGQFNIYSGIRLTVPFIILVFNLLLIYVFKVTDYLYYIAGEIIAYIIIVAYIELYSYSNTKRLRITSNLKILFENFRVGFFIMCGNLAMILFFTLGRWAVKVFMTDADFAYFSFASSMMQVITIVLSSVAMTFYPYLSRMADKKNAVSLKRQLIIIGALLSSCYFIFSIAVKQFIPKYETSLKILGILFASFPAYAVINALYINLYKVLKDGKKYIKVILTNLFISCIITAMAIVINKNIITISIATTISYYFWLYYSAKDFEGLKPSLREVIFIILYLVIFTGTMLLPNPFLGIIIFLPLVFLLSCLYTDELKELISKLSLLAIKKKNNK